MAAATSTV